jgi:ABC-type sugar transport system ATPase subunit
MNRLTAEGKGILMISSELPELLGMSDRVLVMREGRVVAERDAVSATQSEILAFALGQAS